MTRTSHLPTRPTSADDSKVSVGVTPTVIVAAAAARLHGLVYVLSGGPVYVARGVPTVGAGYVVNTGEVFEHLGASALNGIVATGTADVRVWEEFA